MHRRTILILLLVLLTCAITVDGQTRDGLSTLMRLLAQSREDAFRLDLLTGMLQGLAGRRRVEMPEEWPGLYAQLQRSSNVSVRDRSLELALVFDDPIALDMLRRRAANTTASASARNRAIHVLVAKKDKNLAPQLLQLVSDPATRGSALRGLAEYHHPATASTLLEEYLGFDVTARRDAVQTLSSRPQWALQLLDAVATQRVPRADLTAYTARQLRNLGNQEVTDRVRALWGEVRSTPAEKLELIESYKERLTPESIERASRSTGRAIYQQTCASCHRLFDAGGNIGPEITGAQRTNLDYVLENLIDPSATVAKDYQMQIIQTTDGRVITGLVVSDNDQAVTIQTVNQPLVVPVDEIENRTESAVSMMPEGMLQKLTIQQVRELVAYLGGPGQVPLEQPAEAGAN